MATSALSQCIRKLGNPYLWPHSVTNTSLRADVAPTAATSRRWPDSTSGLRHTGHGDGRTGVTSCAVDVTTTFAFSGVVSYKLASLA